MKERDIQNKARIELSRLGVTNFRNNTGMGWAGQALKFSRHGTVHVQPGDALIKQAYPLHAGLHRGSGDIIGINPITITAEMVGQTIGQFFSGEVKSDKGRLSQEQIVWHKMVIKKGGLSITIKGEAGVLSLPLDLGR